MKKLYKVEVSTMLMVLAEDAQDAEDVAIQNLRHEENIDTWATEVLSQSELINGWDYSIPHGSRDNKTCSQILALKAKK